MLSQGIILRRKTGKARAFTLMDFSDTAYAVLCHMKLCKVNDDK